MAKIWILMFILPVIPCSQTYAENSDNDTSSITETATVFLALEGMVFLNSTWASNSPQSFGTVLALTAPIAMEKVFTDNSVAGWSLFIAVESLALYNLSIDEEETTKDDIFKKNMIAMNALAVAVISTALILSDDEGLTVSYLPTYSGGILNLNYEF